MKRPTIHSDNLEQYNKVILERLLSRRNITESGCWEWTGSYMGGYGRIKYRSIYWYSHRLIMFLLKPDIYYSHPCILHTCDNPKCINPDHLWGGTHQDNVDDMLVKGRYNNQNMIKEACIYGHEFTIENTGYNKNGSRYCKACKKETSREYEKRSGRSLWRYYKKKAP